MSSAYASTSNEGLLRSFRAERLRVEIYETRRQLGAAAARVAASEIRRAIEERGKASVLLASAPSQIEMLAGLVAASVGWRRVVAFHVDEYLGVGDRAPHSFRRFLLDRVISRVPIAAFHGLRGEAPDAEEECRRYAALLETAPPDDALLGIGENGHLAFNDPSNADFNDSTMVRVVELEESCRLQQVHDGVFSTLAEVPARALTLSIPAILKVPTLVVAVPGPTKQRAVQAAIEGPVSPQCPASILRTHPGAHLFLDRESAALLPL